MGEKYTLIYWRAVLVTANDRAFKGSKLTLGLTYFLIGLFAIAFVFLIVSLGLLAVSNLDQQIRNIAEAWWSPSLLAVILFVFSFAVFVFKIPPELQKDKESTIDRLEKELSFKGYDDIEITRYDVPWTESQRRLGVGGMVNSVKIGLRLANKGNLKIRCRVKAVSLFYNGHGNHNWQGGDEWIDAPTPVDNGFIRWEEGNDPKVEIPSRTGFGNLWIAESIPMNVEFRFWFSDGMSDSRQLLEGRYCLNFQVEGDFEKNSLLEGFHPLKYQMVFKYQSRRLKFISIERNESTS